MPGTTNRAPSVLSPGEVEAFRATGFLRREGVFSRGDALALRDAIWAELGESHGIRREDRRTWRQPPCSPRRTKDHPLADAVANAEFQGAISDLLGRDSWPRPKTWGGFLVTFPEHARAFDVPADSWHWDGPPGGDGLLVFSFFSEVRPGGGGTLVLSGSPRLVADFYADLGAQDRARPHAVHRRMFRRFDPYLERLMIGGEPGLDRVAAFLETTTVVRGSPCRVVELTGSPGDVVFCDPGMLHAPTPNTADEPRFMRVKFLLLQDGPPSGWAGARGAR